MQKWPGLDAQRTTDRARVDPGGLRFKNREPLTQISKWASGNAKNLFLEHTVGVHRTFFQTPNPMGCRRQIPLPLEYLSETLLMKKLLYVLSDMIF